MKSQMIVFLLIVGVAGVLSAAGTFALIDWSDVGMSGHGFLAMALGVGFTILVAAGLMALLFYSNRHGHDDDLKASNSEDETS